MTAHALPMPCQPILTSNVSVNVSFLHLLATVPYSTNKLIASLAGLFKHEASKLPWKVCNLVWHL